MEIPESIKIELNSGETIYLKQQEFKEWIELLKVHGDSMYTLTEQETKELFKACTEENS